MEEAPPTLPPRRLLEEHQQGPIHLPYFPPPPQRSRNNAAETLSNSVQYMRDPHRLTAYIVPFPKPKVQANSSEATSNSLPDRFLIYTPPAPPLIAPKEGEKEDRMIKLQRKWQAEVREAKTNKAKKTVGLEEMVLVYPSSILGDECQIREEFVNNMLRFKSKAQKDAVIATGLIPVSFAVDVLLTFVWPFGGLLEIDSVWAYSSIRGAKTARSVTKRLHSSSPTDAEHDENKLKLSFVPSPQIDVLRRYLAAQCHARNPTLFSSEGPAPIESEVLEAVGWSPSQHGGETRNWEDEQWEIAEVKDDLKQTMGKGAREWDKWCKAYQKDPEKALKK
ncbi:hypothetical protein EJ08DRAFT_595063 [Tothia fuscella]|uniref:Secreted protein n=1 Tax=Tothia fuscella TaxID=1048955 RepID=A0A9P4NKG0_9PEZI|nr:hypothetical protein EJ08DRAFT_595063 [Tothia fuscella]